MGEQDMTAYLIVYRESPVRDEAAITEYSRRNMENATEYQAQFGTKPLVVYGRSEALEGPAPDGIVMLEFPTLEAAKGWYDSPACQATLPLRLTSAADWRVVIVEGLPSS
jgi:uncharacterized protein (DUF1330 family)